MRKRTTILGLLMVALGTVLGYAAATGKLPAVPKEQQAQQSTGVPGSPSATTTIDGRYLPNPPPKFGGEINLNAFQSKPYWPPRVVAPKGAPNVLLIMTDDCGFGAPSTFGGVIPTPALDRIAKMGLRYTNMSLPKFCCWLRGLGRSPMHRTYLLLATAFGEGGIGLLLLVWPPVPMALLLGVDQASPEVAFCARIAGAALLALAVACWMGRNDHDRPAQQGLLLGVLIYDLAATGILASTGWFLSLAGIALWPAVGLHAALAVWCAVCLRKGLRNAPSTQVTVSSKEDTPVFKWVCLLVAIIALSAYGWMLNDIRLDVKGLAERTDQQLPRILTQTEQVTSQLDRHLPKLLNQTEQAVTTINSQIPQVLTHTETAVNNLAELSDSFRQYEGLMGVVHAGAPQNKGMLSYGTSLLDLIQGQPATIGVKKAAPSKELKQPVPAKEWASSSRKDVQFLSLIASTKAEVLHGLARTNSARPLLIQIGDQAPRLLADWIKERHPDSKDVK